MDPSNTNSFRMSPWALACPSSWPMQPSPQMAYGPCDGDGFRNCYLRRRKLDPIGLTNFKRELHCNQISNCWFGLVLIPVSCHDPLSIWISRFRGMLGLFLGYSVEYLGHVLLPSVNGILSIVINRLAKLIYIIIFITKKLKETIAI